MKIVVAILSVIIFIKTLSYGIYEFKSKNKSGGVCVILFAILSLILPNIVVLIRGK